MGERVSVDGLATADACALFEGVAAGVASAHRRGVVHGRIRPENVLIDEEGNGYLADLGVDEICAGIVTRSTTAYDAPERLGGLLPTPAADVYSLGVLLHYMLSGLPSPHDRHSRAGDGPLAAAVARAIDPDPSHRHESVDQLIADVRNAVRSSIHSTAVDAPARNPYRGLAAFEQADTGDFYGRVPVVAELLAVVASERLLVVVGPSGIGKSSVIKAGLVPALGCGALPGSESWLITEMVPGRAPLEQLAAAVARVSSHSPPDVAGLLMASPHTLDDLVRQLVPRDSQLLILVDQLEELFTHTVEEGARRAFLEMVKGVAEQPARTVRIVATLRSDYLDRPLRYPGFGRTRSEAGPSCSVR